MQSRRSPVSPSWEVAAGQPSLEHTHTPRSAQECSFRQACPLAITLFVVLVVAITLIVASFAWAGSARAQSSLTAVPIGGFQPWVAFTLTNEFSNENQDDLFFVADVDSTFNASRSLPTANNPIYRIGLLDSGSQVNLLTDEATTAFDLAGTGFTGTEVIVAQGVSGTELLTVQDPLGIFTTGLQNASAGSGGSITVPNQTTLRGLKSNAPASAQAGSVLPNVIGLPMMSTHTTVIRNSQPQFIEQDGTSYRAPAVEFLPLGSPIPAGFTRRAALALDVNATFGTTEPLYIFNVNNAISGEPLHENPSTPTAVGGAFFTDIDITNAGSTRTAEVFFDTGAQVTVVNELLAAQLGFDVVNDTPDFTVPIIGVGGAQTNIPGFYADSLTLPAVGGNFTATNVPIVVLTEVPNPKGTGILDGILGTNVFWNRDLVIDPNGSRLWISDPVTNLRTSPEANFAESIFWGWNDFGLWEESEFAPDGNSLVNIRSHVSIGRSQNALASKVRVGDPTEQVWLGISTGLRLDVFYGVELGDNARLLMSDQTVVSAANIEIGPSAAVITALFFENARLEGTVTNRGILESGIEIVGDYEQRGEGTLAMFDGGLWTDGGADGLLSVFGALEVSGNAMLGGAVLLDRLLFGRAFVGERIDLVIADAIVGVFDRVVGGQIFPTIGAAVLYESDRVVAELALFGDANLNQAIEQGDLDAVLNNWGSSGMTWVTGDFTGDGVVSQGDLDAVLNNWGSGVGPSFAGFTVPEPGAGLLVLGGVVLLKRRRGLGLVA